MKNISSYKERIRIINNEVDEVLRLKSRNKTKTLRGVNTKVSYSIGKKKLAKYLAECEGITYKEVGREAPDEKEKYIVQPKTITISGVIKALGYNSIKTYYDILENKEHDLYELLSQVELMRLEQYEDGLLKGKSATGCIYALGNSRSGLWKQRSEIAIDNLSEAQEIEKESSNVVKQKIIKMIDKL